MRRVIWQMPPWFWMEAAPLAGSILDAHQQPGPGMIDVAYLALRKLVF
jgi:hypothetical protein